MFWCSQYCPFPKLQILDYKLKEFADDNFKFHGYGRKFSKRVQNTVGKGEIARYEQFLLFPPRFQKICTTDTKKPGLVWEGITDEIGDKECTAFGEQYGFKRKSCQEAACAHRLMIGLPLPRKRWPRVMPCISSLSFLWIKYTYHNGLAPPVWLSGERDGSWPGGCEFDSRLRRIFFPAYFRLSAPQKHARKVVGGIGNKICVSTGYEKAMKHTCASPPWYDLSC